MAPSTRLSAPVWPGLLVLTGIAVTACASEKADGDASDDTPTWHRDIAPIVQGRCVSCHQEGEIGPFSLGDYATAAALADAIAASVEARTMPPWGAEPGLTEYLDDPSLSDDHIALFRAWADAGAPEGDPSEAGEPWDDVSAAPLDGDLTLRSDVSYTVDGDPDDYRCFVIPWPEDTETKWVTGFDTDVDNRDVVHHVAAYLFRPDNVMGEGVFEQLQDWDDADPLPGYQCYGGPAGDASSQIPAQQLAQWVPGMGGVRFPEGSGIEVPPGSWIVLQMHYFDPGVTDLDDRTGLVLELADDVQWPGAFAPWLSGQWPIGGMDIPAGDPAVEHEVEGDPRGFFEFLVGGLDMSEGFDVHSSLLHLHKLGVRGELDVTHADGSLSPILTVDPWDFDWQRVYRLAEPIHFRDGDSLRLKCTFDNSADNPQTGGAPVDTNWGEGSEDEMCVGNLFITVPME